MTFWLSVGFEYFASILYFLFEVYIRVRISRYAYFTGTDLTGSDSPLAFLMVFKVLRLFRLARTVRLLAQFKVLWMLVRGLMCSLNTIFFTFVIMFLIIYVYACIAIEFITKSDLREEYTEFNHLVESYLG